MRKTFITLTLIFLLVIPAFSQSQGISYQAVIISNTNQEIPGNDIAGNIIPNRGIMVRFSILNSAGSIEYQEEHATTTDAYGMINLIIGKGTVTASSAFAFTELDWNGTPKDLKVDISLSQSDLFYTDFSYQELNFIPYAYHKNITATGSLSVDGKSTLQDLSVQATTNLNGSLNVNFASPTVLSGSLKVEKATTLDSVLTVNSKSRLNGQVEIFADINGVQELTDSYPLIVRGSSQGISIKVDGSKSSANNFLLFSDDGGVQGRIEGESDEDVYTDPKYIFDNIGYTVQLAVAIKDLVSASTSSTVCVGLGACVTTPVPSLIIGATIKVVVQAAQIVSYNYFRFQNAGVVYKTKGADYAEYLPKANPDEVFYPGDIIGIKGGYVTKKTDDADLIMVVSSRPIVLGNLPEKGKENAYVKVAFIGQAPAKVLGIVNPGDYIIASGNNDGSGVAISPNLIHPFQYQKIVGVAWPNVKDVPFGYVNIAVGLNSIDVSRLSMKQEGRIVALETELSSLKDQIAKMNAALAQLLPNYVSVLPNIDQDSCKTPIDTKPVNALQNSLISQSNKTDEQAEYTITYHDISKEQILESLEGAKESFKAQGIDIASHPFFVKMSTEPGYQEKFVNELMSAFRKELNKSYDRDIKTGAKVIKLF